MEFFSLVFFSNAEVWNRKLFIEGESQTHLEVRPCCAQRFLTISALIKNSAKSNNTYYYKKCVQNEKAIYESTGIHL